MGQNKKTVQTYDEEADVYLGKTAKTVEGSIKTFLDRFMSLLNSDCRILEVGAGNGRDAEYLEKSGFTVLRTDAALSFVERFIQLGYKSEVLDIVTEKLDTNFDAILANAVFLHFDDEELHSAFENSLAMLTDGGILALTFMEGEFQGTSHHKHSARYFHERKIEDLEDVVQSFNLQIVENFKGVSISQRKNWIMLLLRKTSSPN